MTRRTVPNERIRTTSTIPDQRRIPRPEEFQDNKTGYVSLQEIENKCNKRDKETAYQQEQREKERVEYIFINNK